MDEREGDGPQKLGQSYHKESENFVEIQGQTEGVADEEAEDRKRKKTQTDIGGAERTGDSLRKVEQIVGGDEVQQ